MNNLLEQNIYDVKDNVLICGTCLPHMQPFGYEKLANEYDTVLFLCLERDHINMAITKICGMISTNKIKKLTFASVNKSPHCTQMHFIKHEIKRIMNNDNLPEINDVIIQNDEIYEINDEVLSLSKDLVKLSSNYGG